LGNVATVYPTIQVYEKRIDFVILRGKYLYSAREVGRIIDEGRLKGDPATIEELRHHFNLRTGKVSPK